MSSKPKARRNAQRVHDFPTLRRAFIQTVWRYYRTHGRHDLPWRKTRNPYRVLVSEVMLQQTQVDRVLPYYRAFIRKFPTARKLAAVPLAEVLVVWQGLGYNRRAKMLHAAAKVIAKTGMPKSVAELEALPGVGPYTARAVASFAYDEPVVFIETNIRTAILHEFFGERPAKHSSLQGALVPRLVSDAQITEVLEELMPKQNVREWNLALMDYGAYLKKAGVKLNAASKHYTKQKQFSGSMREARGAILRALMNGPKTHAALKKLLGAARAEQLTQAQAALLKEGLIEKRGRTFVLPR